MDGLLQKTQDQADRHTRGCEKSGERGRRPSLEIGKEGGRKKRSSSRGRLRDISKAGKPVMMISIQALGAMVYILVCHPGG